MIFKGMEYKDQSGNEPLIEQLIEDDGWVMQQKFDGTRSMIHLTDGLVAQRNGKPLKHTAATQWVPSIIDKLRSLDLMGDRMILDCELIIETGHIYIFDVVDPDNLEEPLSSRLNKLEELHDLIITEKLQSGTALGIHVVDSHYLPERKRMLIEACRDREGVVAKKLSAPYHSGIRTTDVLKLKNTHTADMVVLSLSQSPLSAGLGFIHPNGDRVTISRASMIGKDPTIQVGDVVEVDYLAWTGASLLQPRIIRKRYDKNPAACNMDQFAPYSRKAAVL